MNTLETVENKNNQNDLLSRDTVFISHANPEDNDFAIWLASQLNNAGYNVWLDENRFKGGNPMWDVIQSIIRDKAIKVIAVLSHYSCKSGVKNEISYADTIARNNEYKDFILPIWLQRVDLPIELNRKLCLDFSENWQAGLIKTIEFLEEQKVPKINSVNKTFEEFLKLKSVPLENKPELLTSNLFSIKSLPENIFFYRINNTKPDQKGIFKENYYPFREYEGYYCSFCDTESFQKFLNENYTFTLVYSIKLKDFFEASCKEFPKLQKEEAEKIFKALVNKSFSTLMEEKGLKKFCNSKSITWWLPKGLLENNKVFFLNIQNEKTRRNLCGISKKVFWNFGIQTKILFEPELCILLKPQILFSEDGQKLIYDEKIQSSYRKSRTKTWYNEKWRELIIAFMNWVANFQEMLTIGSSSEQQIIISSRPLLFECPISLNEDAIGLLKEEETDDY